MDKWRKSVGVFSGSCAKVMWTIKKVKALYLSKFLPTAQYRQNYIILRERNVIVRYFKNFFVKFLKKKRLSSHY